MENEDLQKLEHELREYNEIDWVSVGNVMQEAGALGYPATEDTAIDCIVRFHEQDKVRVGTYINGAPGGFVPWEEPIHDLRERLRAALVPTDPADPLGPVTNTMIDFIA
ncbi:hypothetical protein [Kocuria oceani]|uniref:DUF3806 domain-containing protein n=1 Tax=Kocuria oceani TaxID=988827 RepID=A0ABV9TGU7_9MICC|nr:hypothetical protein [Kocuria oceani]